LVKKVFPDQILVIFWTLVRSTQRCVVLLAIFTRRATSMCLLHSTSNCFLIFLYWEEY